MNTLFRPVSPPRDTGVAGSRTTLAVLLCCAVYFTSYLTRKCYDASILAICESTGLARTAAGLASTAAVVLYGSGQLVAGFLADVFDPRRIVFAALAATAACNLAMPAAAGAASVPAMVALWAANGFAQSMFWPPIVKLVAESLPPSRYRGCVFWISVAADAAVVAVFVLVSGCVRFAGWRLSFRLVAALAMAMALLWAATVAKVAPKLPGRKSVPAPGEGGSPGTVRGAASGPSLYATLAASGLFFVMAAITCQGVMRDGIEVWAPSIVRDQYGLGTSGSIFSVALLPVFGVASMAVARAVRRALGDEMKAAAALFAAGLCCSAFLFATNGSTLAVGLPVMAVLSASMHGTNLMLIGELPGRFAESGRVGTVSGLLNACTYVGSAVSIYGFAALHERFSGWRPVFALWIAVTAAGIAVLAAALKKSGNAGKG